MLITWLENVNFTQFVANFFYWFQKISSTKWRHTKGSEIPICKSNSFPLEAFSATEFNEIFSGKQLRQDVKVFPKFRVCLWLVESTKPVSKKVYGRKKRDTNRFGPMGALHRNVLCPFIPRIRKRYTLPKQCCTNKTAQKAIM